MRNKQYELLLFDNEGATEDLKQYLNDHPRGVYKEDRKKSAKEWREYYKKREDDMKQLILDMAEHFQDNPDLISEMLMFGSQFYQYSFRNTALIYNQNPHATYVQSFKDWKKMDANILKGEKGIQIFVPVKITLLEVDGKWIKLADATEEQKEAAQRGELRTRKKQSYKIGSVFDISQTDYPKEKYPELYQMGFQDMDRSIIANGLKDYCKKKLNCPVRSDNLKSIALRGQYSPVHNVITLNEQLEDSEFLSTLSHEMGHALIHNCCAELKEKSTAQVEFEADALSVMVSSYFGMEVLDGRKRHLSDHYQKFAKELGDVSHEVLNQTLEEVYKIYQREIQDMKSYIENRYEDMLIQRSERGEDILNGFLNKKTDSQKKDISVEKKRAEVYQNGKV